MTRHVAFLLAQTRPSGGMGCFFEVTEVVDDGLSPIIERPRAITHMQPMVLEYL